MDIEASKAIGPNFDLVRTLASECFMPVTYGGGVSCLEHAEELLRLGVEKISVNSAVAEKASLIDSLAARFGSSTLVVSVDIKSGFFQRKRVFKHRENRLSKTRILLNMLKSVRREARVRS